MTVLSGFNKFGADSVTMTVKDPVQELTISSQEYIPPAWSLLLLQRQDFLKNRLARVQLPLTGRDHGVEERSALKCRRTRYRHKRVTSV